MSYNLEHVDSPAEEDSLLEAQPGGQRDEPDNIRALYKKADYNIGNFAPVARIMKSAVPDNAKIAKEAKECMQECVSEFISFITSEGMLIFPPTVDLYGITKA